MTVIKTYTYVCVGMCVCVGVCVCVCVWVAQNLNARNDDHWFWSPLIKSPQWNTSAPILNVWNHNTWFRNWWIKSPQKNTRAQILKAWNHDTWFWSRLKCDHHSEIHNETKVGEREVLSGSSGPASVCGCVCLCACVCICVCVCVCVRETGCRVLQFP
jgi:hypothetical protein